MFKIKKVIRKLRGECKDNVRRELRIRLTIFKNYPIILNSRIRNFFLKEINIQIYNFNNQTNL